MTSLSRTPSRALVLAAAAVALAAVGCGGGLDVGSPIPAVAARDQDGQPVDLAAAAGSGYTLVYFYPKANSPDCTQQACSLRDVYDRLSAAGVKVYGVSLDTPKEQKAFRDEHRIPFTLIADPEHQVIDAFGVPRPGGFAKRQAFLFRDGRLVWRDLSPSPERHGEEVLAAVSSAG
jgi:peroxiredoxin Q/BCP